MDKCRFCGLRGLVLSTISADYSCEHCGKWQEALLNSAWEIIGHNKEGEAMKEYGYYVEGDGLICLQCGGNPLYDGVLTRAEAEGYPDGFTCADCGKVIEGESDDVETVSWSSSNPTGERGRE